MACTVLMDCGNRNGGGVDDCVVPGDFLGRGDVGRSESGKQADLLISLQCPDFRVTAQCLCVHLAWGLDVASCTVLNNSPACSSGAPLDNWIGSSSLQPSFFCCMCMLCQGKEQPRIAHVIRWQHAGRICCRIADSRHLAMCFSKRL